MKFQATLFVATIVLACGLGACSSLSGILAKNETGARAVITYATLKAIDEGDTSQTKAKRADTIRDTAEEVLRAVNDESFTLSVIDLVIERELAKVNLAPPDRFALDAFVRILTQELRSREDGGLLDAEQRVQIATVLMWIVDTAGDYKPQVS